MFARRLYRTGDLTAQMSKKKKILNGYPPLRILDYGLNYSSNLINSGSTSLISFLVYRD